MNKKNLLIVTSTFPRWKNDTDPPFVFELARRLTDSFNVTVLTPSYPGSLQKENIDGIQVHRFRYFLKKYEILAGSEGILPTLKKNKLFYFVVPFFILGELFALLKLIRKTKPYVVHAHWILLQGFVAALAFKITGVPFVVTVHGGDIYSLQGAITTSLKKFALKNAAKVTVVSKDIQKTVQQKFGADIQTEVIPMGVDSSLFHPDKKDQQIREKFNISGPFLLFIGRLTEKKGVRYLIKAMPDIIKQNPAVKLLIIGSGEERKNLEKLSENPVLTNNVIFLGAIPNKDLPAYFATADIFIGPSIKTVDGDTEGFGLTFVEAGMSGCIVLGTDVGGISDIIQNGNTGFLLKEKSADYIAKTVNMILAKGEEWSHMKEATRYSLHSKFDWSVIAEKYKKIFALD